MKINTTYQPNEAISTLKSFLKPLLIKRGVFQQTKVHGFFSYVHVSAITMNHVSYNRMSHLRVFCSTWVAYSKRALLKLSRKK